MREIWICLRMKQTQEIHQLPDLLRQILEKTHGFNIDTNCLFMQLDVKQAFDSTITDEPCTAMSQLGIPKEIHPVLSHESNKSHHNPSPLTFLRQEMHCYATCLTSGWRLYRTKIRHLVLNNIFTKSIQLYMSYIIIVPIILTSYHATLRS